MTESTGKLLGLDYGRKRIGFMVSYATLAEPLTIIENDDRVLEKLHLFVPNNILLRSLSGFPNERWPSSHISLGSFLLVNSLCQFATKMKNFTSKIVHEKQLWLQGQGTSKRTNRPFSRSRDFTSSGLRITRVIQRSRLLRIYGIL